MWKFITLVSLGIIIFLCLAPRVISYKAPDFEPFTDQVILLGEPDMMSEVELLTLAGNYADQYGVSRETIIRKTKCETPIVVIDGVRYYDSKDPQSRIRYNDSQIARHPNWGNVGDREDSWGPAQIHLPDNPEVTREQASDPDFALEFMAKAHAEGKGSKWSCK